jgi:aryl-phospho-beta-D-glucosidase BglC (GH1 family)
MRYLRLGLLVWFVDFLLNVRFASVDYLRIPVGWWLFEY